MKNKKIYVPVSVSIAAMQGSNAILGGSITPTEIRAPKDNVSIGAFEIDKDFEEGGFGDISF